MASKVSPDDPDTGGGALDAVAPNPFTLKGALDILKVAIGSSPLTDAQKVAWDFDGDGTVNLKDALLAQKYAIGSETPSAEILRQYTGGPSAWAPRDPDPPPPPPPPPPPAPKVNINWNLGGNNTIDQSRLADTQTTQADTTNQGNNQVATQSTAPEPEDTITDRKGNRVFLDPEQEAAHNAQIEEQRAEQNRINAANAAAAKAKADARDPSIESLVQQLGGDNQATRAIAASLYDKYDISDLKDLGRGQPYTYDDPGEYVQTSSGDSGNDGYYAREPGQKTTTDWVNKRTGQTLGRGLDLGYVDKDKVGTTYFSLGEDGTLGQRFQGRAQGFLWDSGLMDFANMVPGLNAYTIPLTIAHSAANGNWLQAAGTLAAQFLPGLLGAAVNNTDLLGSLSGSSAATGSDFNPTATTPSGMALEAATGIQGNLADVIGGGVLGGVTSALSGGNAVQGAALGALNNYRSPVAGNLTIGDLAKGALIVQNLSSDNPNYAKALTMAGELARSRDTVIAGKALALVQAIENNRDGRNIAGIANAMTSLSNTVGANNVNAAKQDPIKIAGFLTNDSLVGDAGDDELTSQILNTQVGVGGSGSQVAAAGAGTVTDASNILPLPRRASEMTNEDLLLYSEEDDLSDADKKEVTDELRNRYASGEIKINVSGTAESDTSSGQGGGSGTGEGTGSGSGAGTGSETGAGAGSGAGTSGEVDQRRQNSARVEQAASELINGGMSVNDAFRAAAAANGLTDADYDRPGWSIPGGDQISDNLNVGSDTVTLATNGATSVSQADTTAGGDDNAVTLITSDPTSVSEQENFIDSDSVTLLPDGDGGGGGTDGSTLPTANNVSDVDTVGGGVTLPTTGNNVVASGDTVGSNTVTLLDGNGTASVVDTSTGGLTSDTVTLLDGNGTASVVDTSTGGSTSDTVNLINGDGKASVVDTLTGGSTSDTVTLLDGNGTTSVVDSLTGGIGSETISLLTVSNGVTSVVDTIGPGSDTVTLLTEGNGVVSTVDSGTGGADTVSLIGSTGSDTVSLIGSTDSDTVTLSPVDSIIGSTGPDTVSLSVVDSIIGSTGSDTVSLSAVDSLIGSSSTDTTTLVTTGAVVVTAIDTVIHPTGSDTVTLLGGPSTGPSSTSTTPAAETNLPIRKVGDLGKYVSPLAGYQEMVQQMYNTAMDEKAQQQQLPNASSQSNENSFWGYGQQEKPFDSIFGTLGSIFEDREVKAATGGSIAALLAVGGASKSGRGSTALVPHSGKMRVDFRHGDAVTGPGDGQSDDIPAMLADGEFVFPADVVSALGNGSTKAGSDKLYEMMHSIRARARKAHPKSLPPPAKSPLEYLRGKK